MKPRVLILSGYGFNCEKESKFAFEQSSGSADIVHLNTIIENPKILHEYSLFLLGGGFSFGDDLGSGVVVANKIRSKLKETILDFIAAKKLILAVCNGFQVVVKLGLLPYPDFEQRATLTFNDSGHFEDRWVNLKINPKSPSIFTKGIDMLPLPVRHGEGKFIPANEVVLKDLIDKNLITAQYADERGKLASYPVNPNGSIANIAGICDPSGRIYGMMPHPEAFTNPYLSPEWPGNPTKEGLGLRIFKNAVDYLTKEGF